MNSVRFAVLTVSDTCSSEPEKDRSGPKLKKLMTEFYKNVEIVSDIVADDIDAIQNKLRSFVEDKRISAVITTGGTGFSPRDVTPEATKSIIEKECNSLTTALTMASLRRTKFAALSRGICGIAGNTLIMNFPGSEKAVTECFDEVKEVIPHALHLINNKFEMIKQTHEEIQNTGASGAPHVCPHKTGNNSDFDRNSPYPMISVDQALEIIFQEVPQQTALSEFIQAFKSPVDIPPFRASIKDGYAMKSCSLSGTKKVIDFISAGDPIHIYDIQGDECFKINTGAPVPDSADCVIQIEDTELIKRNKNGDEELVNILIEPKPNVDIRPIGCDLAAGSKLFPTVDLSPIVMKSLMASVGEEVVITKPKIAIVSTGSELVPPLSQAEEGQIFDSNTTMLESVLKYFDFPVLKKAIVSDSFSNVEKTLLSLYKEVDFVICSGGVSMGDKDYIKNVLKQLNFQIHFGRVNMKPGKPMTFASTANKKKFFFGLPGNPVSAFVTFHLFALPALRWSYGCQKAKCIMPKINVILENQSIALDPRPEYLRASITLKDGKFYAKSTGNQMSSRLQSIVGADVLVHLPGSVPEKTHAEQGDSFTASILRHDFISSYA